jgi:hypothetical protein
MDMTPAPAAGTAAAGPTPSDNLFPDDPAARKPADPDRAQRFRKHAQARAYAAAGVGGGYSRTRRRDLLRRRVPGERIHVVRYVTGALTEFLPRKLTRFRQGIIDLVRALMSHVGWRGNRVWASRKCLADDMTPEGADPVNLATVDRALREAKALRLVRVITDPKELADGPGPHDYPEPKGYGPTNCYDLSGLLALVRGDVADALRPLLRGDLEPVPTPADEAAKISAVTAEADAAAQANQVIDAEDRPAPGTERGAPVPRAYDPDDPATWADASVEQLLAKGKTPLPSHAPGAGGVSPRTPAGSSSSPDPSLTRTRQPEAGSAPSDPSASASCSVESTEKGAGERAAVPADGPPARLVPTRKNASRTTEQRAQAPAHAREAAAGRGDRGDRRAQQALKAVGASFPLREQIRAECRAKGLDFAAVGLQLAFYARWRNRPGQPPVGNMGGYVRTVWENFSEFPEAFERWWEREEVHLRRTDEMVRMLRDAAAAAEAFAEVTPGVTDQEPERTPEPVSPPATAPPPGRPDDDPPPGEASARRAFAPAAAPPVAAGKAEARRRLDALTPEQRGALRSEVIAELKAEKGGRLAYAPPAPVVKSRMELKLLGGWAQRGADGAGEAQGGA